MRFTTRGFFASVVATLALGQFQVFGDSIDPESAVAAAGLSSDECEVNIYFTANTSSTQAPSTNASESKKVAFSKKFIKAANWTSSLSSNRNHSEGDTIHFFGNNNIGSYIVVTTEGDSCGSGVTQVSRSQTISFGEVVGSSGRKYYLFALVSAFSQYNVQVVMSNPYSFKLGDSFDGDL